MSIFDGGAGMNPLPWLQEKSLTALKAAARLVDIAKEPDTTSWYAKTLTASAESIIGPLAPVVALLYGAGAKAASHDSWSPILDGGTFALARWCKEWEIADPRFAGLGAIAEEWNEADRLEKDEILTPDLVPAGTAPATGLKLELYSQMAFRMATGALSEGEQRLLNWLLYHLRLSEFADVCTISKRFLPTDLGLSREATADAYRGLYERGWIERVENLPNLSPDALAVRIVLGETASKHPFPYQPEDFGYEGSRIRGLPTMGQVYLIRVPEASGKAIARWQAEDETLEELRTALQSALGEDRAYIEAISFRIPNDQWHLEEGSGPRLAVRLRYPLEDEDDEKGLKEDVERELGRLVQERVIRLSAIGMTSDEL